MKLLLEIFFRCVLMKSNLFKHGVSLFLMVLERIRSQLRIVQSLTFKTNECTESILLSYRNHLNGHLGQVRRTTGFTKVAATETQLFFSFNPALFHSQKSGKSDVKCREVTQKNYFALSELDLCPISGEPSEPSS